MAAGKKYAKGKGEDAEVFDGVMPQGVPIQDPVSAKKRRRRKTVILSVFLALCFAGGGMWYLLYGHPDILDSALDKAADEIIGQYGSTKSYIYYPIDYDLDINSVPEYLELDRGVHLKNGAETLLVTADNADSMGEDARFFVQYFETVVNGDYNRYNKLFTENYYKTNEPYYSFTSQMIYDILVEKLNEKEDGGVTTRSYNVSYKIYRNNGTFRNDIGSDGSKTLYFELNDSQGTLLIDRISYYVSR